MTEDRPTLTRLRTLGWEARYDLLISLLAGLAGVAGSFAFVGFTPSFVVAPVEGALSRTMPGAVVTFAIENLGSLGQQLNLLSAIALVIAIFAIASLIALAVGRRLNSRVVPALLVAGFGWSVTVTFTGNLVASAGPGLAMALVLAVVELVPGTAGRQAGALPVDAQRRRVLGSALTAIGFAGIGYLVGRSQTSVTDDEVASLPDAGPGLGEDQPGAQPRDREELLGLAREYNFEIGEMDSLLSQKFYQVDINAVDPTIDVDGWSLRVTGEVENELEFSLDDLKARQTVDEFVTLRCVGESLNGHKMDNALWTGTPVASILEEAQPKSGCGCVMLRAEDGYFEEFPLAALKRGMLAYGMNDKTLPRAHGYPLRALIPGHWGEINVKWLTEIEILDKEMDGYWEKRGWHGTGPVNTVAKIHGVEQRDGRVLVGGHTYAGTRGIERVEVSIDGGDTWTDAELTEKLPGIDVWRQWRYEYDHPGESHEVVARATDGTGTLQPKKESRAFPSGPTGWVSRTIQ